MTHTKEDLSKFTKTKVKEIARTLNIKGRTTMSHNDLIDAIVTTSATDVQLIAETIQETAEMNQATIEEIKPETPEALEFTSIPKPQEFFNLVIEINDRVLVHQACNALLDKFAATKKTSTISKDLTAYKKLFYNYQHANPSLNETIETKSGTNTQHIAARLLTLSDEQKQILGVDRNERDNARAGFDNEGELREVEKPPIDITAIVKKSCELLASNDPHTIGVAILNLTGLRANEQNMSVREYDDWGLIERDMVVVDEFVIGFKGISKKKDVEDTNAYHTRATLAPAQMIVNAQKRFKSSKAVQAIPTDYEKYRKGFLDTFSNRFTELFGIQLSTIEAYDDNGNLTDKNGTPHKARAFYACALRAILKTKGFGDSASSKYIQLCLAHESQGITVKYLGRYDASDFINPIDINIPTNIKELGKMTTATIEQVKTEVTTPANTSSKPKKTPKDTFDIDAFIGGLDADLQVKFAELMNSGSSVTNAVLGIVNVAKEKATVETRNAKKPSVSDEVDEIVNTIMIYNEEQSLATNRVVPAYTLINKISERFRNKTIAKVTVDRYMDVNKDKLHTDLEALEIPGGLFNSLWNGKNHRKTMDTVIESVISILNQR